MFAGFFLVLLGIQAYWITQIGFQPFKLDAFQKYLNSHSGAITGPVWVSSPITTVYTQLRTDGAMCHPACGFKKLAALRPRIYEAELILVDSKDLRCPPGELVSCSAERTKLLEEIKQNFHAEFYYEQPGTSRMLGIFKKKSL